MPETGPIRTLVVEDVALAREKLARLLAAHPQFRIEAEAGTLAQAVQLASARRFELVLLDIGLPDGSGLDLLQRLPAPAPYAVFVTAHAGHALRSYDLGALDYLLKPLDAPRVALALRRIHERLRPPAGPPPRADRPLAIRQGNRTLYLAPLQIDYIDCAGHYACVHVGRTTHLLRESIAALAESLAPAGLVRVHRSAVVNPARVAVLHERRNGDAELELHDGSRVPVSRSFRAGLDARLPRRG